MGTVVKEFGITSCFEFIKAHPEYRLTCKGAVEKKTAAMISRDYSDLISSGKVVMNDQYLSSDQFIQFISRFRIGFCFYDWDLIRKNFNYATAPSGKLFVYLAAGVPVIASNIPGFAFIREQKAGVLVDDYSVESIYNAILEIEKSYDTYAANAYKVFEENCFDRNADAFVDFLKYSD